MLLGAYFSKHHYKLQEARSHVESRCIIVSGGVRPAHFSVKGER